MTHSTSVDASACELGWPLSDRPDLWIVPGRAVREGDLLFRSARRGRVVAIELRDIGDALTVVGIEQLGRGLVNARVSTSAAPSPGALVLRADEPVLVQRSLPAWLSVAAIAEQLAVDVSWIDCALLSLDLVVARAHSRIDGDMRVYSPSVVRQVKHALDVGRRSRC